MVFVHHRVTTVCVSDMALCCWQNNHGFYDASNCVEVPMLVCEGVGGGGGLSSSRSVARFTKDERPAFQTCSTGDSSTSNPIEKPGMLPEERKPNKIQPLKRVIKVGAFILENNLR